MYYVFVLGTVVVGNVRQTRTRHRQLTKSAATASSTISEKQPVIAFYRAPEASSPTPSQPNKQLQVCRTTAFFRSDTAGHLEQRRYDNQPSSRDIRKHNQNIILKFNSYKLAK